MMRLFFCEVVTRCFIVFGCADCWIVLLFCTCGALLYCCILVLLFLRSKKRNHNTAFLSKRNLVVSIQKMSRLYLCAV